MIKLYLQYVILHYLFSWLIVFLVYTYMFMWFVVSLRECLPNESSVVREQKNLNSANRWWFVESPCIQRNVQCNFTSISVCISTSIWKQQHPYNMIEEYSLLQGKNCIPRPYQQKLVFFFRFANRHNCPLF